jgi:hypothetical protein
MASSDEYQQIQFWEKLKKKKTFCEEMQDKFLKQLQKDTEQIMHPNLDKKNDTRII